MSSANLLSLLTDIRSPHSNAVLVHILNVIALSKLLTIHHEDMILKTNVY